MICDSKQLKKLTAITSSLETLENVIYFDDDDAGVPDNMGKLKVVSFSEVERLGKASPVPANLPSKNGIAVIMYTSGSTGLPKVCLVLFVFLLSLSSQKIRVHRRL